VLRDARMVAGRARELRIVCKLLNCNGIVVRCDLVTGSRHLGISLAIREAYPARAYERN